MDRTAERHFLARNPDGLNPVDFRFVHRRRFVRRRVSIPRDPQQSPPNQGRHLELIAGSRHQLTKLTRQDLHLRCETVHVSIYELPGLDFFPRKLTDIEAEHPSDRRNNLHPVRKKIRRMFLWGNGSIAVSCQIMTFLPRFVMLTRWNTHVKVNRI